MTEFISQRHLPNDSGRVLGALDEGRGFVITRHGQPIGELRPLRRDRFVDSGLVASVFSRAPHFVDEQLPEDLDAYLDRSVEPRT